MALVVVTTGAFSLASAAEDDEARIAAQRALFLSVYEAAERGDWSDVWALAPVDRELLADYVLWPDLRAAYLRATLGDSDPDDVDEYLSEYGTLKPARELRYRYALALGRQNELDRFNDVYKAFYQGRGIARLDCLALGAEIESGNEQSVALRARDLWLVPRSQVDECDPLFEKLKARNLLGQQDYERRYELAIEARNFTLARWLGKSIDDEHATEARRWLAAQSNPATFIERYGEPPFDATRRAQLVYAVERLTYADPLTALKLWTALRERLAEDAEPEWEVDRHIALWMARDRLDGAYAALAALAPAAQDTEVLRWRARVSLRDSKWRRLLNDIERLPETERQREQWPFWRAVALGHLGRDDESRALFATLAAERSYHGFLAADAIGAPYALDDAGSYVDSELLGDLAARLPLVRARELYLVGLDGRGRSEWDSAVAGLSPTEQYHAAVLADRWGWHSRAIATVAAIGEYDDLSLRYPLPYRAEFETHAGRAAIEPTWAYGIARSESLFMRDVRSSAGAIGLMQLMPATGRRVARAIDLPYHGIDTLTDPVANIRLGTTYLAQMAERYGGNTILATAAYNAGPLRVDSWLPVAGPMDARAWIENIPFNETRRYVRRVVTAEAIFHWRLTGEVRRLSDVLADIDVATPEQLATR